MTQKTRMYWLQAITPLHVGAGKGVGFIDMPIMREKVTNWPLVPGSAVKGVMRDHFEQKWPEPRPSDKQELIDVAFGTAAVSTESNAGSLVLTDAHIVCMPVRSLYGTFAYVTCPMVLERLKRDLAAVGFTGLPGTPAVTGNDAYNIDAGSKVVADGKMFFEDLDFTAKSDKITGEWAEVLAKNSFSDTTWQGIFKERFVILPDDCFNFLSEMGTEVAAHIKIDDTRKIVSNQALWYEEALPSETILAGIAWCDRIYTRKKENGNDRITEETILTTFCPCEGNGPQQQDKQAPDGKGLDLQIGGKATVGKGRVVCRFTKASSPSGWS